MTGIKSELTLVLNQAAQELNLTHFSLNLNEDPHRGDGFLGQVYKESIFDKDTNTTTYLVVKKAPIEESKRDETCIENAYNNEIDFYTQIMPAFRKFQQEFRISDPVDYTPSYITSIRESGREMVVLEDITLLGYQMREKDFVLDEEHADLLFRTYGRYHALSFCFRDQRPEEYGALVKCCRKTTSDYINKKGFSRTLRQIAQESLSVLVECEEHDVAAKFRTSADKTAESFIDSISYQGKHSAILHGDCWSNNMMFKYQDPECQKNLEDVKLIDFQMIWSGTPVYDLSYLLYSGGSAKIYRQLEHYLDLYHDSFSQLSRKLGSDPEELLPREVLTQDWKRYAKFGMFMALILIKVKMWTKEQLIQVAESIGLTENGTFINMDINTEIFKEKIKDLLMHMYDIGAL